MPNHFNFEFRAANFDFLPKHIYHILRPKDTFCCNQRGQVLLDIVIAMGIFGILIHAIFSLTLVIYDTLGYTRTRVSARHIASEKMELLLNLPYNNLGTTQGIPNGMIPEFETVNRNGMDYTVHTSIIYIDDPFDNQSPNDLLPTDYKQVRIEVTWPGQFSSDSAPIVLVSNVSPRGIETSAGGGTLSIFVIDAQGQPVSKAQVHITNSLVTPTIDMSLQTNEDGRVILPGAPPCATCYNVTATKTGFTTDRTYTTTEVANPNKRPITVTKNQLSELTFVIDAVSTLTVNSFSGTVQPFSVLPNSQFRLTGTKTIGTDSDGDPVYKVDNTYTTNSSGSYTVSNLDWDNYILTIPITSNQDISGIYPHQPMAIAPAQTVTLKYTLTSHTPHSLLLSVTDASGSAIASASALLSLEPAFVASHSTGLENYPNFGQAFFSSLATANYAFTVSHPNFATASGTILVDETTPDKNIMTTP